MLASHCFFAGILHYSPDFFHDMLGDCVTDERPSRLKERTQIFHVNNSVRMDAWKASDLANFGRARDSKASRDWRSD